MWINMAIHMLLLLFFLTTCAARVLQRDNGVVRVALSRYVQAYNLSLEKRQYGTGLPQFGGEIYFIQGMLCH